jgi:small subunit ribosomal protein S6
MFIVRPDVAEEDVDKLIAGFNTNVTNGGGVVKNVDKFITVRIDEEEKRLAKVKALRGTRRKVSAEAPAAAAPAAHAPVAAPPVAEVAPESVPASA